MRRISRALSVIAAAVAIMVATVTTPASGDEPPLEVGPPSVMSETPTGRIDVMGIWSAPDTAATMTAQCGVWQDLYGVGCGIIALSRGEEPLNEAGEESGAALALRRENEARAAFLRSGTVDIFHVDVPDLYRNLSATPGRRRVGVIGRP